MKKIYFFLIVSVLCGLTLHAQDEGLDLSQFEGLIPGTQLITGDTQLSSNASDEIEGQHIEWLIDGDINTFWHSDWHSVVPLPHYITVELTGPTDGYVSILAGRRKIDTNQFQDFIVHTSTDGTTYNELTTVDMPNYGQGTYVASAPFYLPAQTRFVRLYFHNGSSSCFHMAELQLYRVENAYANEKAVEQLLLDYDGYLWDPENCHFDMGEGFGQYNNYEAEKLFLEGLQKASAVLDNGSASEMSVEEIQALINQVRDNYQAVLDSEVLFTLTDGYYRLVANKDYYVEKETGDVDLDGNPVVEREPVTKALYGALDETLCWGTKMDSDARYLWRLEQTKDGVKMVNVALGEQLSAIDAFSEEADTLMGFDFAGTENGHDIIYIRFAGANRDKTGSQSVYIHQWYHGQGAGVGHQVCAWVGTFNRDDNDKGTSEWYLEPVPDEDAQQIITNFEETVKKHALMVLDYETKIAEAETAIEIARDVDNAYAVDTENPYFTDAAQFTSLWSEATEGSIDGLLDDDANTFWHSNWSSESLSAGGKMHVHSFELSFSEPVQGWVKMYMQRRNQGDNHPTNFSLYGTNDDALLADPNDAEWELVCTDVKTPWQGGQTTVYSQAINIAKPYRHLRFYIEGSDGGSGKNNGFFHMGALQLYPAIKQYDTQFDKMGEAAITLDALVQASKEFDHDNLTTEQYNEFVAAYEAFFALMADPADLRNAVSQNQNVASIMLEGTNPGYWSDMSAQQAMQDVLDKANAYLTGGVYKKDEMDAIISEITDAAANVKNSVNPIRTDKWYHLRFAPKAYYDRFGWNPVSAQGNEEGTVLPLFDRYLAPGAWVDNAEEPAGGHVDYYGSDMVKEGTHCIWYDAEMVDAEDPNFQFCFVPLSDNTFAIRHRTTGLFLQNKRIGGEITLQNTPTEIEPQSVGYGQHVFRMQDLDGRTWSNNYLNSWRDHLILQTWSQEGAGGNCAMLIEEAEDIDVEEESSYFKDITVGQVQGLCYPVSVKVENGAIYAMAGTFEDEDGTQYVALNEVEQAQAGQPFVYINGSTADFDGTTTQETFYLGTEVTRTPETENGLTGIYYPVFIENGYVVFSDNKPAVTVGTNIYVDRNSAYVVYGTTSISEDDEYDLALAIDGHVADGIHSVIADVNKGGKVYTLNGQLVGKATSLKDVKRMGRGTYIVNGVKVLVR